MIYILNIFGVIIFLYIFWSRLKEHYISDQVYNSGFLTIFGIIIAYIFAIYINRELWFWFSLIGALTGLFIASYNNKMNYFELLDGFVYSVVSWLFLLFVYFSIISTNYLNILFAICIITMIFVFRFIEGRYKSFTWYRTGKIGFAGLFTLGIFFLIRSIIGVFSVEAATFIRYDFVISLVTALLSLSLLYVRGIKQ